MRCGGEGVDANPRPVGVTLASGFPPDDKLLACVCAVDFLMECRVLTKNVRRYYDLVCWYYVQVVGEKDAYGSNHGSDGFAKNAPSRAELDEGKSGELEERCRAVIIRLVTFAPASISARF